MDLLLRDAKGTGDVGINIGELVSIKGAIFHVNQLEAMPPSIRLQPANSSQIQQYLKENQPTVTGENGPQTSEAQPAHREAAPAAKPAKKPSGKAKKKK